MPFYLTSKLLISFVMAVHDLHKIDRFARENFSVALMSDTKWRDVMFALKFHEPALTKMTVKFIGVEQPKEMKFPPRLQCPHAYMDTIEFGPVELRAIEWLSFNDDVGEAIEQLGKQVPIDVCDGLSLITGYLR